MEGGAELAKRVTCGVVPVIGSLYVDQYKGDMAQFVRAVNQVVKNTDGLMVFDIVHVISYGLWDELLGVLNDGSVMP